jgi:hypothetical protein
LETASRNFSIFASGAAATATAAIAIREGEEEGSRRGADGRRFQMTGGGEVVVCETVWFALIRCADGMGERTECATECAHGVGRVAAERFWVWVRCGGGAAVGVGREACGSRDRRRRDPGDGRAGCGRVLREDEFVTGKASFFGGWQNVNGS